MQKNRTVVRDLGQVMEEIRATEGLPEGLSTEAQLWDEIMKKYQDKIYFNVGCEVHANIPTVSEEQLREDVHTIIDTFGDRLMADVFISNVECQNNGEILKDEIRRYGSLR